MVAEHHPTRHDRESITITALRLLDEVGLPDLSMRRLASELGVQPSALYWHFANKQELLAAVADRILVHITATTSSTDSDAAVSIARGIRDALLSYRDGAEVVMSSYALGFGAERAHAALVDALSSSSAEAAEARASVLLQFILGHALVVQQRLHAESYGGAAPSTEVDPSARFEAAFDLGVATFLTGVPTR